TSLWESLAFGRGVGGAGGARGAASIGALAYVGLVPATRAPLMATLAGTSGQPNFVAAVTATGDNLIVVPATLLTSDPRAIELWLILPNQRPRSLGLIPPGQPLRLSIPPDLAGRLTPAAALAVAPEPPGGSPTGQPPGPVSGSGNLTGLKAGGARPPAKNITPLASSPPVLRTFMPKPLTRRENSTWSKSI